MGMLSDLENGGVPLSPGLATRIIREFRQERTGMEPFESAAREDPPETFTLTNRQTEILKMVANGFTYKKVSEKLGLSERTIKYHMGRIIELLHLKNRTQVIAYAAKMGMTEEE
jgi:two-component system NarL family response regulator